MRHRKKCWPACYITHFMVDGCVGNGCWFIRLPVSILKCWITTLRFTAYFRSSLSETGNFMQYAVTSYPLSSVAGLVLFLVYFPFLTPLPPSPCLFGCCCSLLAHTGLSYCSISAAERETETGRQWEREECRTVRDGRRILMTRTAAKSWQWLHVHHSAFVTMDSGTLTGQIERKRKRWGKMA